MLALDRQVQGVQIVSEWRPRRRCQRDIMTAPIPKAILDAGYVLLEPAQVEEQLDVRRTDLNELCGSWDHLCKDVYLRDGGSYRSRRHSCFVYTSAAQSLELAQHRAHWQPVDYNALHGGMQRWFEPIDAEVQGAPGWRQLLAALGAVLAAICPVERWYIEAHQFRIDTAAGIGRPTPEGAHRDGVDYVAILMVQRRQIRGGETRVFQAEGPHGVRFTMLEPWTLLLLDDARVIHETTPIQPADQPGVRDTLVLTYRQHGFQAPQ
jgi:hypothetical protein